MVDNPTKFIIFVGIIVVLLTLIITSFKSSQNGDTGSEKNTKPQSSKSGDDKIEIPSFSPSSYDAISEYTDTGFMPAVIEIKSGQTIRFTNNSSGLMQISSVKTKENLNYGDFNQERTISKGYFFDLTFSKKGTWFYQNLNDKSKTGIVIVK